MKTIKKFNRYQKNLSVVEHDGNLYVKSYSTLVAKIDGDNLLVLGYWSMTTSKHINYAASQLNLTIVK
jgi:hypothetical protein